MNRKVFFCISILLLSTTLFYACSKKNTMDDNFDLNRKQKLVEILVCFPGDDLSPNMSKIQNEIEKRTEDNINVKLNFQWINYSGYEEKIKTLLNSGKKIDGFSLYYYELQNFINNNNLKDITRMLPNNAPEIYKNSSKAELERVSYEEKIYALPPKSYTSDRLYAVVRDDFMKKYKLKDIKTLDDYEAYLKAVTEKENTIAYPSFNLIDVINAYLESLGYIEIDGRGIYYNRYDKDCKITPMENLPEYRQAEAMLQGWVQKNYINPGQFNGRPKRGQFNSLLTGFDEARRVISGSPDTSLKMYPLYPDAIYSRIIPSDNKVMAFNNNSLKVNRLIQFLNWIYSDQANYDLMVYGIKNKDYKLNNKGKLIMIEDKYTKGVYYSHMKYWTGGFFENLDFNRPLTIDPDDYWNKFKLNFEKLNKFPLYEGATRKIVSNKLLFQTLEARMMDIVELRTSNLLITDDYNFKLQQFREKQRLAGIDKLAEAYQKELKKSLIK